MNFLAHFYLSGNDEGLLIGNFIADAVKGKAYLEYPEKIQRGIILHREIDHFTDSHPVSSAAKVLLRDDFNHYSGVVLDVFYDHFLAKNWERFHAEPLPDFAQKTYAFLEIHARTFPEKPKYMLPFMKTHNWLTSYAHLEGIDRVMSGMASRAKYRSHMEHAGKSLRKNYEALGNYFEEFFPLIVEHTKEFRS